jgi:alkyl hydroperoxide reductase subunit AhpC
VDDQQHNQIVWNNVVKRQFTILGDPGARVIRSYGLLHAQGGLNNEDIAIDASVFVDAEGRERWRRVSATLPDIPSANEILDRIRKTNDRSAQQ